MARRTYIFAGPSGSASVLMSIIETATSRPFIREPGSDPYIRSDPVGVYITKHDFDDGDVCAPDGTPIPLQTGYPYLADIRDTERDLRRQRRRRQRSSPRSKQMGVLRRSTSMTCSVCWI